jgi:hypothetical protein
MAGDTNTAADNKPKSTVLGRSAATGRFVFEPIVAKKGSVSDKQIAAAVKSVFATKK